MTILKPTYAYNAYTTYHPTHQAETATSSANRYGAAARNAQHRRRWTYSNR